MSTQLALGVVGAGIGFFFGSPQLGFVIGSLIGSLLDPPKTQGPRLGDTKLQKSSYGSEIPMFWGTGRIGGNIIDQTDLEEHEEKSSGKGGPENTEYTYSASFAVLLGAARVFGEPAILGVNKIWADARLIWDSATSSDPIPCTVYYGTEDQLPDPTFEAIHGVGEVPAHRGYAYVVFADYYLTDFFNRIPNLEFEVYTSAGNYPWQVSLGEEQVDDPGEVPLDVSYSYADGELTVISRYNGSGYANFWVSKLDYLTMTRTMEPMLTIISNANHAGKFIDSPYQIIESIDGIHWWMPNPIGIMVMISPDISVEYLDDDKNMNGSNYGVVMDSIAYGFAALSPTYLNTWSVGGNWIAQTLVGAFHANTCALGSSDTGHIYVWHTQVGSHSMYMYDSDLTLIHSWNDADILNAPQFHFNNGPRGNFFVYRGQLAYNRIEGAISHISLVNIGAGPGYILTDDLVHDLVQADEGWIAHMTGGLCMNIDNGVFSLEPPPGAALLSTIVGNLTDKTPAVGQYDVSELTDEVPWFIIASQMTVRNAIQVLRPIYHFDAVESDDQIKYRKRTEVSAFAIPDGDLDGRQWGDASGVLLKTNRTREQEIPRTVTITYIDIERDYQIGTQSTTIQTRRSEQDTTIEVPVGLTQDQAYQKCWTLINAAWIERETFEWSTTRKWAHLEPCDVGLIHNRVIRIQTRVESPDGVIRWTGVLAAPSEFINEDSSIYFQPGTGAPSDGWVPPSPPASLVATEMFLLDIPLLSDSDYPNGFYCAVGPAAVGRWPGAAVYKSVDGGTTYNSVGETLVSDTIGLATSTLGDWDGGNNFDESNTLDVALNDPDNELDSYSEEAVLNGAGGFLIGSASTGWEVAQYKTATLTAPGLYTLTGFLRGRYGTEWMMPLHDAAETFILLRPTININSPIGELNATRKYKAVTLGTPIADADAQDFTNTGVALKPYSVVHLEGGRNGSGDLIVEWIRRTRIGGVWLESVEVPLGEPPPEAYYVRFYSSISYATMLREVFVTSASTYTYTAADQTTDFGSPQATIHTEVVQAGPYNNGYETRAAL